MEKIKQLTQEQFNIFKKSNNKKKVFKEMVGLNDTVKYEIGDTYIEVNNSQVFDLFKNTYLDRDIYYLIIEPVDENLAFAYSLYPIIS